MYPTGEGGGGGGGGAEDFRGGSQIFRAKKGGKLKLFTYLLGGCLFFAIFCLAFVTVLKVKKEMISKDCKQQGYLYYSERLWYLF